MSDQLSEETEKELERLCDKYATAWPQNIMPILRECYRLGLRVCEDCKHTEAAYAAGRSAGLEEDVKHITDLLDMAETGHELHGLLRAWINRSTAVLAAGGMGK